MAKGLLRLLSSKKIEERLTPDDVENGIAAVEAQISSLQSQKRLFMKANSSEMRKKWGEADEEEQMLKRLLAEYQVLKEGQ